MTAPEKKQWETVFEEIPNPLTNKEKEEWMSTLKGVSCSSDAFFPFRDGIDQASKSGVKYVVQPGGSVQDQNIVDAADEYGMIMAFFSEKYLN